MRRCWSERLTALCCIVAAVCFGAIATDIRGGAGSFQIFIAAAVVVLAILMITLSFMNAKGAKADGIAFDLEYARFKPLIICAVTIAYVFGIFHLGFYVSSVAFLCVSTWIVGIRCFRAVALTAAILFPAMYGVFELFLGTEIPRGVLF